MTINDNTDHHCAVLVKFIHLCHHFLFLQPQHQTLSPPPTSPPPPHPLLSSPLPLLLQVKDAKGNQ